MKENMKKEFNYWVSKFIGNENTEQVVRDLYWCYYKYNSWTEAESWKEIVEALNFENSEALADRITNCLDFELDEETQREILFYITASQLGNDKGWN